jgi:hypothetical protein
MRPISVFRPFSEEIQAIIPIQGEEAVPEEDKSASSSSSRQGSRIVTLGKGYRSLVKRFVTHRKATSAVSAASASVEYEDYEDDANAMAMSALLWRPDDWICA